MPKFVYNNITMYRFQCPTEKLTFTEVNIF